MSEPLSALISSFGRSGVTAEPKDLNRTLIQKDEQKSSLIRDLVEKAVLAMVAQCLGTQNHLIERNKPLGQYGFNSVTFTALSTTLNQTFAIENRSHSVFQALQNF